MLHFGTVQKELVDPYCTVSFAGKKGRTPVIWNEQDPEWNHQINLGTRVSDHFSLHYLLHIRLLYIHTYVLYDVCDISYVVFIVPLPFSAFYSIVTFQHTNISVSMT